LAVELHLRTGQPVHGEDGFEDWVVNMLV